MPGRGVQPKRNGQPYRDIPSFRKHTPQDRAQQDANMHQIKSELDYVMKYGYENLLKFEDWHYDILVRHGSHVAEFCRKNGKDSIGKLSAHQLEILKSIGPEEFNQYTHKIL